MAILDYNELIQRKLGPTLIDTKFNKEMDKLVGLFGLSPDQSGDRITDVVRTAWTSNAAAYTKSDVNPDSDTQQLVKAYWDKKQYHASAETYGIDMANLGSDNDVRIDMAADKMIQALKGLKDVEFDAFFARLLADIDSSATAYSDASLSRSTYPTLASGEETTDATITAAYVRAAHQAVVLNKNVVLDDYIWLMEQAVYNKFNPIAAAEHTWNQSGDVSLNGRNYGYAPTASFDGVPIYAFSGMTTGSAYLVRRQDVKIVENRPMETEEVDSGRDSSKMVFRHGYTPRVINPGYQYKILNKD